MIDLTNTWCYATVAVYNKLTYMGYDCKPSTTHGVNYYVINKNGEVEDLVLLGSMNLEDKKQIHLVDVKFEYVKEELRDYQMDKIKEVMETKEECQFAKYGFEKPDFECEILKEVNGNYVGWANGENKLFQAVMWQKNGYTCINHQNFYNLTPLKKEWYETKKVQALLKELLEISEDQELNQVLKAHILED